MVILVLFVNFSIDYKNYNERLKLRNDCTATKYAPDILLVKEVKNGYGRLFL